MKSSVGGAKNRKGKVPWPYSMFSSEKAQVMPVAVLALAILFLVCMLVIVVGIGELRMSRISEASLRAYRIAEAGVSRAMNQLRSDNTLTNPETSGAALNWPAQTLDPPDDPVPASVHTQNFAGGTY
ncbi:MAG: hypothetical protein PHO53_01980, partial [Actinomycetota bacterium]|nr:hypothetical protein [Actinomycetota bacterium]